MASPQQFREFAQACVQMAKETSAHDRRARLINMAEEWHRLAEEAERFEQLMRDVDQAFDAPSRRQADPQRRH